jgi:orotate phosphoribosyltransferase
MDEASVLSALRDTGAMLEGHFELSSGLHSDRYFQCARVLQHPARAEALARGLAPHLPACDVVVGPALGAVTWAHEVARALGVRGIFTERQDGVMRMRRFELAPDERVLVVEDVLTTGGSAREVIEVVRGLGARVVGVAGVVNRSGRNPFADLGLDLWTLVAVTVEAWQPDACPLCAAGGKAVKPGSRPDKTGNARQGAAR